jgi:large subunit ribosomal protein L5
MSEDKKDKKKHEHGKGPISGDAKAEGKKGEAGPKGGGKKEKKPKQQAAETEGESDQPAAPAPAPRLIAHYREKIVPELKQKFGLKNVYAVPRLEKIMLSMGLGKAVTAGEKGKMEQAEKELGVIAGQKPVRCKAKKSVANFKVREGQETGLKVTLRGNRMYEFLDRLITLAIPRVRDFRGLNPDGFDKNGNFNFGFTEQTVFPEVNAAEVTFQQGMNVTMVTTAANAEQGRELLRLFGFPFRTDEKADR